MEIKEFNELVIIFWEPDNIEDLKVYVNQKGVELQYPYTHRVAKSIIDYFGILLKEYPEDIQVINEEVECKFVNLKNKEYLIFIENEKGNFYHSSISLEKLKNLFPEIFRKVVKGVRLDVH